jgi:hypothetical protein
LSDFVERMNAKDCLRLGVPLGEATRRATDFVARFILGGGATGNADFSPLHRAPESRFTFSRLYVKSGCND